jgi:hypothetical protein
MLLLKETVKEGFYSGRIAFKLAHTVNLCTCSSCPGTFQQKTLHSAKVSAIYLVAVDSGEQIRHFHLHVRGEHCSKQAIHH